jgi:hypothetical protein
MVWIQSVPHKDLCLGVRSLAGGVIFEVSGNIEGGRWLRKLVTRSGSCEYLVSGLFLCYYLLFGHHDVNCSAQPYLP